MDKRKTLVLTGFDDAMAEVGYRCAATHQTYARWNGYAQEVVRYKPTDAHPSYMKMGAIAERIADYDAILWLDADTVVMNKDVKVEALASPSHVMTISLDWCSEIDAESRAAMHNGVSCGNFIVRNTPDTARFMATWAQERERFATRPMWEQDALRYQMGRDKWMDAWVCRLPRRSLNAVHRECVNRNFPDAAPYPYQHGDFLLHLTNVDRVRILNELGL